MKTMLKLFVGMAYLTFAHFAHTQQRTFINKEWESSSGNVGNIQRTASTLDAFNNVIITSNTVNANGTTDVQIEKYNSEGQLIWQQTFNGNASGNDHGVQVITNSANDIFVAAVLEGTNGEDFGILKYNAAGTLLWSHQWDGAGNGVDILSDIKVDNSGNVFVTGGSEATNGFSDYAVLKVNGSGGLVWAKYYDHANLHDAASSIELTGTSVVVTGASASTQTNWDYATLELDPTTGAITGTQRTNATGVGLDNALAVVADNNNNIYVTGYVDINGNKDIRTLKFDSALNLQWMADYNGQYHDEARSIDVDDNGNVYVSGYTQVSPADMNFITIKYNANGTQQWEREFGDQDGVHTYGATQVVCDNANRVIVIGTVNNNGAVDFLTLAYDTNGEMVFLEEYDSNADDKVSHITIDGDDYYITGTSTSNGVKQSTIVKYSAFYKDQPITYHNGEPSCVDDELLVRFNPASMITTATDNYNKTWGLVEDFVNPTAIANINGHLSFDIGKQECYKVFPNFTSTDTTVPSRSSNPVKLPPYYATLGVILPNNSNDSLIRTILNGGLQSVRVAEQNGFASLNTGANDPEYMNGNSASLRGTWQIPDAHINIEDAWAVETGSGNIIVGIYDSGINNSHDDISNGSFATSSIKNGYDYYHNTPITVLPDPDFHGHGTVIAGIVGAWRNNNLGIAGVAGGDGNGGVSIHDMKMFHVGEPVNLSCDIVSSDLASTLTAIADGTAGIVMPQQDVMNFSWQINDPGVNNALFLLREAIITTYDAEITLVVSSGNDANAVNPYACTYPSCFRDRLLIRTGANDATGGRAVFSNSGENLDILAPGTNDLFVGLGHDGSDYGYDHIDYGGNCIMDMDGTSFAAPHVAGAAALMHSYNLNQNMPHEFTPEDIEALMQRNATDLTAPPYQVGYDDITGWGRLNVGEIFKNIEYPRYRVEHYERTVESPSYTLVGIQEEVCLEESMFGLPVGEIKVNRYEMNPTFNHTLPNGYQLITGWANGSKSDIYGINSGVAICLPTALASDYLPDAPNPTFEQQNLTSTNVSMKGYTYELLDANNNPVGWWPFDLNHQPTFHYSLYLLNPSIPGVVGVEENKVMDFAMYPNPTNNVVTIEMQNDGQIIKEITITDLTGKLVKQHLLNGEAQKINIPVKELGAGIYFVKVRGAEYANTKKLVIK